MLLKDIPIKDQYQLLGHLFANDHKHVYIARDSMRQQLVAIKEARQSILDDWAIEEIPELISSIEREPLLLAGLSHPQIPRYYDTFADNDAWYLVMDFVDGDDLRHWLFNAFPDASPRKPEAIRTQKLLAVAIQLCNVLAYLHTHTPVILHRDIKPTNIIVTPQGHVKLIDFGISVALEDDQQGGTFWGFTPGYAAPEQERNEWMTTRSDLYSLGVMLSCLFAGQYSPQNATRTPFVPATSIEPAALRSLLTQMTDQNPWRRPATAQHIGKAFREILDDLYGGPCSDDQLQQWLAAPSAICTTRGEPKTWYQGQRVWYQYRVPTTQQDRLDVLAKISYMRSQDSTLEVEITFRNPHIGAMEKRWLSSSQMWRLSTSM